MAPASESRAAIRALAFAALTHLALAVALLALPRSSAPLVPQVPAAREVEVEVVASPAGAAEPAAPRAGDAPEAPLSIVAASGTALPAARAPEPAPIAAPAGEIPAGPLTLLREPAAPPIGLALRGTNPFQAAGALPDMPRGAPDDPRVPARAGPRAPTNAEAKQNAEAVLRAPARERERELGLGPDGPVLAALSEAASLGTTSVKGRAVFLAIADGTGMVIGIDVLECDGGRAGWQGAAAAAQAALKGKKLRLPTAAKGAQMRIEIVSAWKLPSGHDPGVDVSVLGLPVSKGEGKQSTKVELLNPIPKLQAVELAPGVNVSVPTVNVTVIAVAGDPADIGARPRRVVHARLLDSKVL
ncbi:MAG TPA: hypothetical protein VLT33_03555 [Labilithrix sp.]|nr:hypothetical protein [Labilithrix sp.]